MSKNVEKLKQYFDEVEFIDYRREDTYGIGLLKRKAPVAMTGAFFLGICINYPNGLFHFNYFKIGPWAEYFLVINGCSVECMHSNYPNTQGLPVANKIFN